MGKSENIKRAKRQKAAKRKKENDALIAAGLGPAGRAMQARNRNYGNVTVLNTGIIKYSELLKEFTKPILSIEDDIAVIKTKLAFAAHAWNAAISKEKSEEIYTAAKIELASIMPGIPAIETLFEEMVKRKQENFLEFKNIIADFEIRKLHGLDYDLTVATIPLKDI